MKNKLLLISFIFGSVLLNAQTVVVTGTVKDASNKTPLFKANISLNNSNKGSATNRKGSFQFKFKYTKACEILIQYLGYEDLKILVSKFPGDTLNINAMLEFEDIEISKINVFAPIEVFKSEKVHALDFAFMDDRLIVLSYEHQKLFKKQSEKDIDIFEGGKLFLMDKNQKIISALSVPGRVVELYKDYLGYVNLIGDKDVFRITVSENKMLLVKLDKSKFEKSIKPCIDTIGNMIYYSNFNKDYPAFDYYAYNPKDSTYFHLRYVIDDDLMEQYRSEYKFMSGRDKLLAFRTELTTGIEKEIVAAFMTGFTETFYYKPLYAPLFVVHDTLMVFDHYSGQIVKYTADHNIVDSLKINYHKVERRHWQQELIKDEDTNEVYALFKRNGFHYLKQIDLNTGETVNSFKLYHKYVENIKIKGKEVFYVYRPFESQQKKYLYKEFIRD